MDSIWVYINSFKILRQILVKFFLAIDIRSKKNRIEYNHIQISMEKYLRSHWEK